MVTAEVRPVVAVTGALLVLVVEGVVVDGVVVAVESLDASSATEAAGVVDAAAVTSVEPPWTPSTPTRATAEAVASAAASRRERAAG